MNVDTKHHKHFVARRGEVLRQIADDFGGVTVSFPRSGVKSERVVIKGAKDCVEGAKKRILEIVADLVSYSKVQFTDRIFSSLPNAKILDQSKFKGLTDYKIYAT